MGYSSTVVPLEASVALYILLNAKHSLGLASPWIPNSHADNDKHSMALLW